MLTSRRAEVEKLASSQADPSVTIYVKTTPLTQEIGASCIALKNHGHQALEQLKAAGPVQPAPLRRAPGGPLLPLLRQALLRRL
jgi:hypothetical protein